MDQNITPTQEQVDDAISDALQQLGYYDLPLDQRDGLALRVADALPGRIHRAFAGRYSA